MTELLKSKKAVAGIIMIACLTIIAIVSAFTGGTYLTGDMYIAGVSAIGGTYLISQGIADNGKAKTEISMNYNENKEGE